MKLQYIRVTMILIVVLVLLGLYISSRNIHRSKYEVTLPQNGPTKMKGQQRDDNYNFPYLKDRSDIGPARTAVVYNRVGKCGSRSMLILISKLSTLNDFTLYKSAISNHSQASAKDILHITQKISSMPLPGIYSRHIHYINFPKFGAPHPIYINLIRDPIERFSSHYHYLRFGDNNRAKGRSFELSKKDQEMDINDCVLTNHELCSAQRLFYIIPYFCGQDVLCQTPGEESLYRAKMHVIENYLVVGYLKDFDGMLQVLESLLPKYFYGVTVLWKQLSEKALNNTSSIKKSSVNETARQVLRERLKEEYEFYNFVKLRFKILKSTSVGYGKLLIFARIQWILSSIHVILHAAFAS